MNTVSYVVQKAWREAATITRGAESDGSNTRVRRAGKRITAQLWVGARDVAWAREGERCHGRFRNGDLVGVLPFCLPLFRLFVR